MAGEDRGGWRMARAEDRDALEARLLPVEWTCVNFTSHLRAQDYRSIHIRSSGGAVSATVMLATHGLLLPVLERCTSSLPAELVGQLPSCLTVMGTEESVLAAERALSRGLPRTVAYHLMRLDAAGSPREPGDEEGAGGSLRIRRASPSDLRRLYPLQRDYEKEEVLLDPALHAPRLCREGLRRALREQIVYLAEGPGGVVAKAGTNARGLRYDQIGGVFTVPALRNRGVGRAVMRALLAELLAEKVGVCLFVKRSNEPALAMYRRLGFSIADGFRIAYYVG